jgi:protein-disulfide isomerase
MKRALILGLAILFFELAFADIKCDKRNHIARLGDNCLSFEDISDHHLFKMRSSLYEYYHFKLMQYVVSYLSKTMDGFELNPFDPSEKEIKDHFLKYGYAAEDDLTNPAIRQKVLSDLKFLKGRRQLGRLFKKAQKMGLIDEYFEKPKQSFTIIPLIKDKLENAYPDPDLVLVEFFDTQSAYCARSDQTIKSFLSKYQKIAYYPMHLPLKNHQQNYFASVALECARDQNLFSELKTMLHRNLKHQASNDIQQYIRGLKVGDPGLFDNCVKSNKYQKRVDNDLSVAGEIGLTQAPSLLIGIIDIKEGVIKGHLYMGAITTEDIEAAFEEIIKELNL